MIANDNLNIDKGDGDAVINEAEFDQSLLDELSEDLGAETFVFLLGKCIEDVDDRLGRLSVLPSAVADPVATRALAHQLKGLFLQFGATAAMVDAAALEAATPHDAGEKLERLRQSSARALVFFERLRDRG